MQENETTEEITTIEEVSPELEYENKKTKIFLLCLASALIATISSNAVSTGNNIGKIIFWLSSMCYIGTIFSWFHLDHEARGIYMNRLTRFMFIMFGALTFPFYFIKTRGIKKGLRTTFKGIGILLVLCIIEIIVQSMFSYF